MNDLAQLSTTWKEILPEDALREEALRIVRLYPLRAADALQLAAAIIWAGHRSQGKAFVCLDDRLRESALVEGFQLVPDTL